MSYKKDDFAGKKNFAVNTLYDEHNCNLFMCMDLVNTIR